MWEKRLQQYLIATLETYAYTHICKGTVITALEVSTNKKLN